MGERGQWAIQGPVAAIAGALALLVGLGAGAPAALAAPGQKGSLPAVGSGQRPGPPLLYRKPATAPQLENTKPFKGPPLLVSGSDGYRASGEYLYQDYLYDDYGANTVPGRGTHTPGAGDVASQTDGDVFYPTAERFAENAADLVELRIKPQRRAVLYRITLNTLIDRKVPMVGIGIDRDRNRGGSSGQVPWPRGAGISSAGLDAFITASGDRGRVHWQGGWAPARAREDGEGWSSKALPRRAVGADLRRNQITIRVKRDLLDPVSSEVWRYVAGAGLHDGKGGWMQVPAASDPTAERPASGSGLRDAPAVFNLAFRFDERQHFPPAPPYDSFPAAGVWFESEQARLLAERRTGPLFADVDFGLLARGARMRVNRPAGRTRARILSSRLRLGEGVRSGQFPKYLGRLQPYLISVPPGYRNAGRSGAGPGAASKRFPQRPPRGAERTRPVGLTLAMHSLGGNHNQYRTYSPNQIRQLGHERRNIVVTPLSRGTDGWFRDEAEVDLFEVWADVAHHYNLDPRRAYATGYSMGGYGTYKLGVQYPDLWARAFTTVGPPAEGIWIPPGPPSGGQATNTHPLLENVRWIPFMNWAEVGDELVPYASVRAQHARFNRLGLRNRLFTFVAGEHFTPAIVDEWGPARDFLGDATVRRNPWRVDYRFFPDADRPGLGLRHDHAYWVSRLAVRDRSGDAQSDPAEGFVSARSHAFGEGDAPAEPLPPGIAPVLPRLSAVEGTGWGPIPTAPRRNALELSLENLSRAVVDGRRARLDGNRRLRISVESDGPAKVRLRLRFPAGARVAGAAGARIGRRALVLTVPAGRSEIVVRP